MGLIRFRGPRGQVLQVVEGTVQHARFVANARWSEVPPEPAAVERVSHAERAGLLAAARDAGIEVDGRWGLDRLRAALADLDDPDDLDDPGGIGAPDVEVAADDVEGDVES